MESLEGPKALVSIRYALNRWSRDPWGDGFVRRRSRHYSAWTIVSYLRKRHKTGPDDGCSSRQLAAQ